MTRSKADRLPPPSGAKKSRPPRAAKFDTDIAVLESSPVAGPWLERLRVLFSAESMDRGLEAARSGRVRRIDIEPGALSGQVRSEEGDTRKLCLEMDLINDITWDRLVEGMSGEAMYAACLLERQWPPEMDALCARFGVPLIPDESETLTVSWDGAGHPEHWRGAALGWLAAERLAKDPLLILEIRGQYVEMLSDRLRQQRTLMTRGGAAAHPEPPLNAEVLTGAPLSECVERFWRVGSGFSDAQRPAVIDHVPHALLRRLGPSTMSDGKFPLSGLLATIYDTVADDAKQIQEDPGRVREIT